MKVDQKLFDAAAGQLRRRWPEGDRGVAAAVYLDDGSVLTGVGLDNINAVMGLCAETGPICQAYTMGRSITASICVAPDPGGPDLLVLAPCGACQERLALWGADVEVAVASAESVAGWESKPLVEVNPHYWAAAYAEGPGWPTPAEHAD
jgi:cytidine deaminase